ncbi:hypothetical protein JW711_05410 [Candidatus Woesearchaeota archaeon]|nr:hypothetical protein [Candidatus Woesearchaeota archaeon]
MNTDLKKSLELRQENLIFLLKNKKEQLELEKQHQIYGAIKEIDYILRMMKYSSEEDDYEPSYVTTSNPRSAAEEMYREDPRQQIVMEQQQSSQKVMPVQERTRKLGIPIRIKFRKNVS